MKKLSGWIGMAADETLAFAMSCHLSTTLCGPRWTCGGPHEGDADGIAVAVRGEPIWRTTDRAIVEARNAADAVREAYRSRGPAFLEVLYGTFAVAVIDTRKHHAVLAVDRMGVERLTYARDASGLAFSTSAEEVARRPGASVDIRPSALVSYLFFHMIPSPETIFSGVRKLAPATAIVLEGETITERTYWRPAHEDRLPTDAASLTRSLHDALETGVRQARPTDASGAFLSGGLDSSTVAGYLGKVTGKPARTFSIGFGVGDYDELRYARIANAHFGANPREYVLRPADIIDHFATIARAYDEPFGNASALPTYLCARLAKDAGVDQLLAGDGGDELFAGNKRYAEQLLFEYYGRVPELLRRRVLEPALRCLPIGRNFWPVRKARGYVLQANTPMPDRLENWNFLVQLGFDTVLHPDLASQTDFLAPFEHMRSVYASSTGPGLVNRMLHYDWRFTLADNDLRKVGAMCELAGIKVSFPILHPDVIDVSLRVPPHLMMRGRELRSFYKRAMRGFLPAEIISKTKHGFGLPFGLWLARSAPLAGLIQGNLADLGRRRVIRPEFLDRIRKLHGEEDARYYGVFIWTLAMLEQWFREHRLDP